jgi:hypothetical protein
MRNHLDLWGCWAVKFPLGPWMRGEEAKRHVLLFFLNVDLTTR